MAPPPAWLADCVPLDQFMERFGLSLSDSFVLTARLCRRTFVPDPFQKFGHQVLFPAVSADEIRGEMQRLWGASRRVPFAKAHFRDTITLEDLQKRAQMSVHDMHWLEIHDRIPLAFPKRRRLWVPRRSADVLRRLRPETLGEMKNGVYPV